MNWGVIQPYCLIEGVVIDPIFLAISLKYWNKGYGLDAINSLIDFAFNKLNLRCIELNVYKYNHRAIKLYKKCGFKEKKVLKKNHFYDGKYWDTFVMDINPERF